MEGVLQLRCIADLLLLLDCLEAKPNTLFILFSQLGIPVIVHHTTWGRQTVTVHFDPTALSTKCQQPEILAE